jgi:hypothetical protein
VVDEGNRFARQANRRLRALAGGLRAAVAAHGATQQAKAAFDPKAPFSDTPNVQHLQPNGSFVGILYTIDFSANCLSEIEKV